MNHYSLEPANYVDYRDFLKQRFGDIKKKNKMFSLQNCAKRSQVSKALLQFLFQKKRHISLDKFPGLSKSLKLTSNEEYFVYLMICKSSSRNPVIHDHFEKILQRIRHEYLLTAVEEPTRSVTSEKSLYLDYLFMALQSLVKLKGFQEDPKWIQKHVLIPGLTEKRIVEALKELENLGFITRNEKAQLQGKPEALWRPDPYDPTGQKVFTKAAEAVASLMQTPEVYKPAVYMSMSLTFDEPHLIEAEKLMIDVHHRLVGLSKQSGDSPTAMAYFGNFMLTLARLQSTKI